MNEETKAATPLKQLQTVPDSNQQLSAFTSVSGFELVQRMAQGLMTADLIPQRYQQNIGNTMIAINMAQRLNCDPLMVMQNLYVVHGSPAWSGQFVIAAINQSGMFKGPLRFVEVGQRDTPSWGYYAEATSRDDHVIKGPTVTMQLAKNEGWINKNPKWVNMPEMMLRYRAGSWFGRTECPEILMGFQSAEEVRDAIEFDPETGEIIHEETLAEPKVVKAETLKADAKPKPRPDTVVETQETAKKVVDSGPTTVGDQPVKAAIVQDGEVIGETKITPHTTPEEQLQAQGWYQDGNRKFNVHGEIWNPDVHAKSSKDGNPIVNADGHFRVRRGGPLPGAEVETIETASETTQEESAPEDGKAEASGLTTEGLKSTPGYEPEPEFIDGPYNPNAAEDWMSGLE